MSLFPKHLVNSPKAHSMWGEPAWSSVRALSTCGCFTLTDIKLNSTCVVTVARFQVLISHEALWLASVSSRMEQSISHHGKFCGTGPLWLCPPETMYSTPLYIRTRLTSIYILHAHSFNRWTQLLCLPIYFVVHFSANNFCYFFQGTFPHWLC